MKSILTIAGVLRASLTLRLSPLSLSFSFSQTLSLSQSLSIAVSLSLSFNQSTYKNAIAMECWGDELLRSYVGQWNVGEEELFRSYLRPRRRPVVICLRHFPVSSSGRDSVLPSA